MSFLDDLGDFASGVGGFLSGGGLGSSLARTAITGYALQQLSKSINNDKATQQQPDQGVRIQSTADTEKKIPVVYGEAVLGGIITDAVLTNGNKTMYYCLTLSEMTGLTNLGEGPASEFTFKGIYWNDVKIFFDTDGITAKYTEDRDGTKDTSIDGLIKVWCFSGSSANQVSPEGYTVATPAMAYSIMPNWTPEFDMNDLVFAIIRVDYNKEKNVTSLGNMKFRLINSMSNPGDCIYDYATNTTYGAGLDPAEVYAQ